MTVIGRVSVEVRMWCDSSNCGCAVLMSGEHFFVAGLCLSGFLVMESWRVRLLGGSYGWLVGLGWDGVFREGWLVFGFADYPVDIDVH